VAQLGYDTIGASNMPTAEQIHSMLDRARTSAIGTPGSSLLAARYAEVPLLSQAWGIGRIGLPFAVDGHISILGFEVPLSDDTDLVASLRYSGSVHLRIEEIAPDEAGAQHTVEAMTTLLNIVRGIGSAQPPHDAADAAIRAVLASTTIEQHKDRAVLSAAASIEQVKALAAPRPIDASENIEPGPPAPTSVASSHPRKASK